MTTMETAETLDFQTRLTARSRSTEIPESADAYGWLVENWELEVRHYWGIDVSAFVQTDVTREPEVAGLVGATLAAYGRLDVAFNNAGVEGTPGSIHEQTVE